MKKITTYLFWLFMAFAGFSACNFGNTKKINKRVTFWRKDKNPYGAYYAYENLKYVFPEAVILVNDQPTSKLESSYWQKINSNNGQTTVFIISRELDPSDEELNTIYNFINKGDQVFISALYFSEKFLDSFKLKDHSSKMIGFDDTLQTTIMNPVDYSENKFAYPGFATNNYFSVLDSLHVRILGKTRNGKANFVNINYQNGSNLYLHLEPFAFSNFFLLHKDNKAYYDYAMSFLPKHTKLITWTEGMHYPKGNNFSAMNFLLNNPPFRWAFWLLLLLILIIYLFESKRKQRLVPSVAALHNSSLDFVKTVGRLYYQRRDNMNLANKIIVHFLGHVRTKYNLITTSLDKEFTDKLSLKSGYDFNAVQDIVDTINNVQQQTSLSDEGLLLFNKKIEEFHKHT